MEKVTSIKQLRDKLNISQKELSKKIGINQSTISNWEMGNFSLTMKSFMKVSDFAKINGYELVLFG